MGLGLCVRLKAGTEGPFRDTTTLQEKQSETGSRGQRLKERRSEPERDPLVA